MLNYQRITCTNLVDISRFISFDVNIFADRYPSTLPKSVPPASGAHDLGVLFRLRGTSLQDAPGPAPGAAAMPRCGTAGAA